eukprot:CAMPEP_0206484860 /NCGR_PEP_ID=MMETSP0324_2-20121206/40202_1 /ASSEMBLY_ACC=CAM_ASM_000836 /TAXON_ID=2866 /ORGANISM="Crypthecodinium cohnii, Strain Seligo" /LENGTH=243 /DNA_ID=CAMNT_0053963041 /DNA_START=92 /DNA_END=823 /DNA_ORIENTATION=+
MDRFYPVGLESHPEAWKTTYEEMNEMKSHPRSAYPPGTSIHLPGQRERFGFSAPGCDRWLLARPELQPSDAVDVPNPREHYAITRIKIDDDLERPSHNEIGEMLRSKNRSPTAIFDKSQMSQSIYSPGNLSRTKSLPSLPAQRKWTPPDRVERMEDEHFSYFVPRSMQGEGAYKFNTHTMSKLHKTDRISFPFSGEGTGFRSESGLTDVFPKGTMKGAITTHKHFFTKPPYHRMSLWKEKSLA